MQTGCLSVASEGLMLQVINRHAYQSQDLEALMELQVAVDLGTVQREAYRSGSHILGKLFISEGALKIVFGGII